MSYDRDPAKRRVKPPSDPTQALLDFDLGESSDDSDFRIEDHPEDSDDYSINSDDDGRKSEAESNDDSSESEEEEKIKATSTKSTDILSHNELIEHLKRQGDFKFSGNWSEMLICAGCLGTRSDDANEIVECDGCGVTVHEGCYGVSDVTSESSTVSSASTEPWFCEACKAGVTNPTCQLCPNEGGIFKETEVGSWVHLVCALYIPGVAFCEVEKLSGVTLFEMSYSRWGARACALCLDTRLQRTGVCVGCDAGLCKTYFHVTCGQREGLLAEAHSEEVEQADPFYAHCKMHSDKTQIKRRKRNWLALQIRTEKRRDELQNNPSTQAKLRIERKLTKYRKKYLAQKEMRNRPWVPTQKMPRMLWSSPSAMKRFAHKAQLMGIDANALEVQDAQVQALKEVSRRWHIPPAFNVEFVAYYLDRNSRVLNLRKSLKELGEENAKLLTQESELRTKYEEAEARNSAAQAKITSLKTFIQSIHQCIQAICPEITISDIMDEKPVFLPPVKSTPKVTPAQLLNRNMSRLGCVPTAAELKMGVGFPLSNRPEHQGRVLSTSMQATSTSSVSLSNKECGICGSRGDQHLLASCDTCAKHYHLGCLRPPLARLPKKSKLYGWQCSECDKTSDSEPEVMEKKVPRKSRTRYSKDGTIIPANEPYSSPKEESKSPEKEKSSPDMVKPLTLVASVQSSTSTTTPLKMTIKPLEYSTDTKESAGQSRKEKKRKQRSQEHGGMGDTTKKSRKRSFTSPTLTNTPLMSITPIVADSPQESPNENSNMSVDTPNLTTKLCTDTSFLSPNSSFSALLNKNTDEPSTDTMQDTSTDANAEASYKANRKRRKEKHRSRYSPDLLRSPSKHKHKRKKKTQENPEPPHPRITIKIKPIPKPAGSVDPQMFYVPTDSNDPPPSLQISKDEVRAPTPVSEVTSPKTPMRTPTSATSRRSTSLGAKSSEKQSALPLTECDVCLQPGNTTNIVRCDECNKRYHFTCLEPPLSRNPKKRGYSWHCADCDPTDVEES